MRVEILEDAMVHYHWDVGRSQRYQVQVYPQNITRGQYKESQPDHLEFDCSPRTFAVPQVGSLKESGLQSAFIRSMSIMKLAF